MAADDSDPGVVDLAAFRAKGGASKARRGYYLGADADEPDAHLQSVCLYHDGRLVGRYGRDDVERLLSWLRRREYHLLRLAAAKAVRARMAALPKPPRTLDAYDRRLRERRADLKAKAAATTEPVLRAALYKQSAALDAERWDVSLARGVWDKSA